MSMYNRMMQGLLGMDPEEEKRITEQQRRTAQQRAVQEMGSALLAASGPTPFPTSTGQHLGQALQAGRQGYGQSLQAQQQAAAERARQEEEAAYLASLDPSQQRIAKVFGVGPFAKLQAEGQAQIALEDRRAANRAPKRSSHSQTAIDMGHAEGTPEHRQMVERLATQSKAPIVNVNSNEYTPFDKAMGARDADALAAWRDQAMAAEQTMEGIGVLRQVNSLQQGGKIGEAAGLVGQYFGTDAAANMQTFHAVQKQMVLKQAEALKGAMSDKDIALLESTLPQYGNDPRANAVILDILERAAKRAQQNYKAADTFASKNRSLRGYQPAVRLSPISDVRIGQAGGGSPVVSLDALSADDIEAELRRRGM